MSEELLRSRKTRNDLRDALLVLPEHIDNLLLLRNIRRNGGSEDVREGMASRVTERFDPQKVATMPLREKTSERVARCSRREEEVRTHGKNLPLPRNCLTERQHSQHAPEIIMLIAQMVAAKNGRLPRRQPRRRKQDIGIVERLPSLLRQTAEKIAKSTGGERRRHTRPVDSQ